MSPTDVLEAVKTSVTVNMTHIDKVVVVCSGRMEKAHSDSINTFLKWLKFSGHKDKFVFVCNKSDTLSPADKMSNLLIMCETFGADTNQQLMWVPVEGPLVSIRSNLALGFPPNARFDDVATDHTDFVRAVLCGSQWPEERIPLAKSQCTIL